MTHFVSPADYLIRKLGSRSALSARDLDDIRALPLTIRQLDASAYLIREGQVPRRCFLLLSGFCYRQKLTESGNRQIVGLLVPGDMIDLQNLHLHQSDHSVQALTRIRVAEIEMAALRDLSVESRGIGTAMWIDALVEASITREWLLNIGRRDARARLAHLICEFVVRCDAAGVPPGDREELPMTQEQLGDALGLTSVHVNRVLQALQRDGLIQRRRRLITINDWERFRQAADFGRRYLHLDQAGPPIED